MQTAFRTARPALFSLLSALFSLYSSASVPLAWQVTPRNPAPAAFDRHHGETLEFSCTFAGFGELPFSGSGAVAPRLYYQTNGMAAAWWSVPASVSSNVLSATFPPSADPGADRLALFFGAPSNAYASAVLRLRHSPGFTPNVLPAPEPGYTETDPVFAAWLATTDLVHVEQDPTVPAWAKSPTPPASGLTTNDVQGIVTNEVPTGIFTKWTIYRDGSNITSQVQQPRWGESHDGTLGWYIVDSMIDGHYGELAWVNEWADGYATEDATEMYWEGEIDMGMSAFYCATRKPICRNALGLAQTKDLPQQTPVDELLLNGADGKVYHLRIGAGGAIEIYLEVTQ